MKLIPLQQWVCDRCGEIIQKSSDGKLEWLDERVNSESHPGNLLKFFSIIHNRSASYKNRCSRAKGSMIFLDEDLDYLIGPDGLAELLLFYRDVEDPSEVNEIVRRLHIPYYEEARLYRKAAIADGYMEESSATYFHQQASIKRLIEKYSDQE